MTNTNDHLEDVGVLIDKLESHGFKPVLVGGMALVTLGSRRVTMDFDFVISRPDQELEILMSILYENGFELIARLDENGEVLRTIDNPKIAAIRLRLDQPKSALFFKLKTELRIDLLFDFPIAATELASSATRKKIRSHQFSIASPSDLIRLKEMAIKDRSFAGDTQDLQFLKGLKTHKITGGTRSSR